MTMASVAADIAAADISYPSGDTQVGSLKLSVSTRTTYDTVDLLKEIPLTSATEAPFTWKMWQMYTLQQRKMTVSPVTMEMIPYLFPLQSSRVKQQFLFPMQ